MTNMTNSEIKKICKDMQSKHCKVDWNFKITQTDRKIKIYWEYLDGEFWTIRILGDLQIDFSVYDEHGDFMNIYLEDCTSLKDVIQSIVYYMVTRY